VIDSQASPAIIAMVAAEMPMIRRSRRRLMRHSNRRVTRVRTAASGARRPCRGRERADVAKAWGRLSASAHEPTAKCEGAEAAAARHCIRAQSDKKNAMAGGHRPSYRPQISQASLAGPLGASTRPVHLR